MYSLDTISLVQTHARGEIGTSECEASSDLYGGHVKQRNGVYAVLATPNRLLSLSRPTLPPRGNLRSVGLSGPIQTAPPQGDEAPYSHRNEAVASTATQSSV